MYIYILNIYHLFGDHCNVDEDLSGDNMLLALWFLPILGLQLEFNKKIRTQPTKMKTSWVMGMMC